MIYNTPSSVVRCRIVWIAGSEIAVIRIVKNQIFIIAVSPLGNVLTVFSQNNYYFGYQ